MTFDHLSDLQKRLFIETNQGRHPRSVFIEDLVFITDSVSVVESLLVL
jgi:hypothetical protein